jgi:hypothetical protein
MLVAMSLVTNQQVYRGMNIHTKQHWLNKYHLLLLQTCKQVQHDYAVLFIHIKSNQIKSKPTHDSSLVASTTQYAGVKVEHE